MGVDGRGSAGNEPSESSRATTRNLQSGTRVSKCKSLHAFCSFALMVALESADHDDKSRVRYTWSHEYPECSQPRTAPLLKPTTETVHEL
jgi:hypothetical protein